MSSERLLINSISEWNTTYPLFVLGPTGSGKTRTVCAEIQSRGLQGEALLVSLDSVAVYQDLDIGSSKPQGAELAVSEWAGLDICPVSQKINVASYITAIDGPVQRALQLSRPVVFVGGSHFYEKAIVAGLSAAGPSDEYFLQTLKNYSLDSLHKKLSSMAPSMASKIHPNDEYRIFRALDVLERQGLSEEDFLNPSRSILNGRPVETLILGLDPSPQLESALLLRIHEMLEAGWVDETRALLTRYGAEAPGLQTVGYREIVEFLLGKDFDTQKLEEQLLISHRQLAKKQRTWLRGLLAKQAAH